MTDGIDWTRPGPWETASTDHPRWCVAEGRDVAVTVHHPVPGRSGATTDAPVVVFCHGLGSGSGDYAAVGAHLASYGMVAVHPEFDDAFDRVRDRPDLQHLGLRDRDRNDWHTDPAVRAALHELLFDPAHWRTRARRVRAVVADLGSAPELPVPLRTDRVVVAGHSFGAHTAQMVAGVRLDHPALGDEDFSHPAVAGAALLSPQGSGDRGLGPRSWDDLRRPLLVVTATEDRGPHGEGLAWRTEPYDAAPAADKWLLVARGEGHGLGGVATSDRRPPSEVAAVIVGHIAAFAAHVAGTADDLDARSWLDAGPRPDLFDHGSHR